MRYKLQLLQKTVLWTVSSDLISFCGVSGELYHVVSLILHANCIAETAVTFRTFWQVPTQYIGFEANNNKMCGPF
jgi:hypothetical protein